tara:strand:+ start:506 stop:775 length:270 start_codon:yes stop_codon:yes gene_type:complete
MGGVAKIVSSVAKAIFKPVKALGKAVATPILGKPKRKIEQKPLVEKMRTELATATNRRRLLGAAPTGTMLTGASGVEETAKTRKTVLGG